MYSGAPLAQRQSSGLLIRGPEFDSPREYVRVQCDRCDGDKVMKDKDGNILYERDGKTPIACTLCLGKGYTTISYM